MRSITIRMRMLLLIGLGLLFAAGVGLSFHQELLHVEDLAVDSAQESTLNGQKQKLKVAVHSMAVSLSEMIADDATREERVETIRKAIAPIRFEADDTGYFFTAKGTSITAHAADPSLHGKDLGAVEDKNGVRFMRKLQQAARDGGGYVRYVWEKPGAGEQPKLSYAEMIPGTDMWLASGVYIDNVQAAMDRIAGAIEESVDSSIMFMAAGVVAALLLIVLPVSLVIFRSISRPLGQATEAAQRIADGDLEVEIQPTGRDEITKLQAALQTMVETLRRNLQEIEAKRKEAAEKADAAEQAASQADEARKQAVQAKQQGLLDAATRLEHVVERLSSSSEEISAQADQINQGSANQRERISETATAVEEMNATVLEVARNASTAAERAESSRDKANEGQEIVRRSMTSMRHLEEIASHLKESMGSLGRKADDIGRVMNVINDIADQTNLLALNAAIEAARAGDAGRGFAVVADEVRKLAEKTMEATKEVGEAIHGIQEVSRTNMDSVEKAGEAVQEAVELAGESEQSLLDIVSLAEETSSQVSSIATAAEQQSAASEQINSSVSEVNRIADENADSMQQTAQAIQEQAAQAGELRRLVDDLKSEGGQAG
ncbi:methyl-accepting chemotaxis protein [Desulfohalovibrio reitneri]|uniref:methyl-accepting chemotaxis protein n=1 Tax=Desulfohalovibrio reitneri TaxID=1307759 RepID=UPI0004A6F638|nr:methyl-accepting chemotaxis protein [Desulfohalovibrio reitneri]